MTVVTIENSRYTLRISVNFLRQATAVCSSNYITYAVTEKRSVWSRWLEDGSSGLVRVGQLLRWPRRVEFDRYFGPGVEETTFGLVKMACASEVMESPDPPCTEF